MDEHNVGERDVVVGIAASGTTPFVHGAIERARERNARTAIIACTPVSEKLHSQVDVAIIAIVGPEVVTGSTRLKAGTATKMVLNMITTGAMIRIGKTYGNLMVDLKRHEREAQRSQRAHRRRGVQRVARRSAGAPRGGGQAREDRDRHAEARRRPRRPPSKRSRAAGGVIRRVVTDAPPPVPT